MLFLLTAGYEKSLAQFRQYDVRFADKSIGTLKVYDKQATPQGEILQVEASFSILFHKGYFNLINHFSGSILTYSFYQQSAGDKPKDVVETRYADKQYQTRDSLRNKSINNSISLPVRHTVCTFYYKEPKGIRAVFSERYGVYCEVYSPRPGTYEMKLPDGRVSTYIFRNGLCQEVRSTVLGGSLVFILQ